MTTATRASLLETFAKLGNHYPDMRLGQLVEFVALLASQEDQPELIQIVDDEALLAASKTHLEKKVQQGGRHGLSSNGSLSVRSELLKALEDMGRLQLGPSFGQLIAQFCRQAEVNVYDAEDDQLLAAIRTYVGIIQNLFELEEAKRIAKEESGQGYTTDQVLEHLKSLEGAKPS